LYFFFLIFAFIKEYAISFLPVDGGTIEIVDGTQNVAPRSFQSPDAMSSYREMTVRGSNPAVRPVIEPIVVANQQFFWLCENYTLKLQNLVFHHTWNATFTETMVYYAGSLILLNTGTNLTMENVIFTTLYPSMLSLSVVIFSRFSNNYAVITNCAFQDLGFLRVPVLFDYTDCLFEVTNSTFRNIQCMYILLVVVLLLFLFGFDCFILLFF
jgi:hypothetical protein